MRLVRQLKSIRRASSVPLNSNPAPTAASATINHSVANVENIGYAKSLASSQTLESAEFQALGVPPTILSVHSPPSVPVYLRRGSLLSVYGVESSTPARSSVQHELEIINPIRRFLYGNWASSYQKIISTTPFSLLASSIPRNFSLFSKSANKSFVSLNLDGTNDWAILDNQALQVYTGNSLKVGMYRLPYTISKKLATKFDIPTKTLTGLHKWNSLGYTLLTGRGQVGLVGNGTVYNINLRENEEILINKDNLLAISVNGPYDLQNCIIKYGFPLHHNDSRSDLQNQIETTTVKISKKEVDSATLGTVGYYFNLMKALLQSTISGLRNLRHASLTYIFGHQEFIKVIGPRNLLLQSNSPNQYKFDTNRVTYSNLPFSEKSDKHVHSHIARKSPADYLNYVTVDEQGAKFKSTPDFKEAIQEQKK